MRPARGSRDVGYSLTNGLLIPDSATADKAWIEEHLAKDKLGHVVAKACHMERYLCGFLDGPWASQKKLLVINGAEMAYVFKRFINF